MEAKIISYTNLEGGPGGQNMGILLDPDACVYWRPGWDAQYTMRELWALASMLQFGF